MSDEDLVALEAIAARQKIDDDSGIDYSDIPPLTDEQLAAMRPARDFEQFRRWQDRNFPELVEASEEARRQWHERHDVKS